MASAFCVPSWMMSVSPCHSATVAISSIGFWCCGGQVNTRLDLDRRLGEGLVGIAAIDLREEIVQRRFGLVDGLGAGRIERDAERLGRIARLDQSRGLDRRLQRLGSDQRDRLAAIGDGRRQHRLEALEAIPSAHDEAGGLHRADILMGQHQPHAADGAGGPGVERGDAPLADGRDGQGRVQQARTGVIGAEASAAADLVAARRRAGVAGNGVSLMGQALCLAIIRASATVRAPSSIRKALSWPGLRALKRGIAARRAPSRASACLPIEHLLGVAGAPGPRRNAHRWRCARRARSRRPCRARRRPRRARRRRIRGRGSCDRSRRGPSASSARGCAGSARRAGASSRCAAWRPARGAARRSRWCADRRGPSTSTFGVEGRERDRPVARIDGDAGIAPAEQRMAAIDAADGRAAAAGLALVAGERLAAPEIGAAGALQEIAADRRHVAELLRGRRHSDSESAG